MRRNIISVIPARGGSKTIPKKNIRLLCGKPLIAYSIDVSLKSKYIDRTIVSTDDKEIAKVAERLGAEVIIRPKELATDGAPTEPVLQHVIDYLARKEGYETDILVLLQPTCPLRTAKDIDKAIDILIKNNADSVVSVFRDYYYSWFGDIGRDGTFRPNYDYKGRPLRQKIQPKYHEIGSIYVMTSKLLKEQKNRMGGKMFPYVINKKLALDINDEFDFWLIEEMIKQKKVDIGQ